MKSNKVIILVILVLLVLFIADIVYIIGFKANAFDLDFYSKEFEKYDVYDEFPDADNINLEVLDYLRDERDDLDASLFNSNEIEHFRDVKAVIQRIDVYFYLALIVSVLLIFGLFILDRKGFFRNLSKVLFFGGVVALLFGIVVLVLVVFDFGSLFNLFHRVVFPQGGWLFGASDNIIKLYPSGFFYDMAKRIFLSSMLYANILILVGVLLFLKNE